MKLAAAALALIAAPLFAQSRSVQLGPDGHLVYAADKRGDHITDFSYAGYMGGGVALPTVAAVETLYPNGHDDTKTLQASLNHAAERAAQEHHPVALALASGTFHLSATIFITSSNVVLRGAGSGKTVLQLIGAPHLGIHIGPSAISGDDQDAASTAAPPAASATVHTTLADVYMPSGGMRIPVADTAGFAVGNTIEINRAITPAYEAFMGMDRMVRDGKPEHWVGSHISVERRVSAVANNTITLDVPLTDSYDPRFGGGHDTHVSVIAAPKQLAQVGVEALALTSPSVRINLSDAHFDGIQIAGAEDVWLRDLHIEDTINTIAVEASARRVTIDQVDILQRIPIQSSAKNFAFSLAGTQTLVMRSSVRGDKVFFAATQAREQGPNVLLHCTFTGDQSIEPHQRWGTGFLVDNVTVQGGAINFINRGTMGSGHGWTMGWGVVWNSTADTITVQSPPGAINWVIGSTGRRVGRPMPTSGGPKGGDLPEGTVESANHRVQPDSLYLQQLQDRLGVQAAHQIGY